MKMTRILFVLLCCAQLSYVFAAEPVSAEKFELVHTLIKPQKSEGKWTQIPWMLELWDARKKAAETGKPILLWQMDGHPLGCV